MRWRFRLGKARLDQAAIAGFVLGLGDAHKKDVLQGITDNRRTGQWADVLGDSRSVWFRIYRDIARRWAPELFIAVSRASIAQDWELALPLVNDLLRRKAFDEALSLIEEAVRALLHLGPEGRWDPREGLFIEHPTQRYLTDIDAACIRLLKHWRRAAAGLHQDELAGALELQAAVCAKWQDLEAVISAFQRVQAPALASTCDRLFSDWKSRIASASIGVRSRGNTGPEKNWVSCLADAARAGDESRYFHKAVRDWLKDIEAAGVSHVESLRPLATLTLDTDRGSQLKKKAPALHRLLSRHLGGEEQVRKSRRRLVDRLRGAELFPEVLRFWKRNAPALVPDPGQAGGSYYEDCADWAATVFELDRQAYGRIVRSWAESYRRRRNLWRALEERQLPLTGRS